MTMHIPYIDLEIKLIILTRRGRVVLDIKEHGKLIAVRNYTRRYQCGLSVATKYINKVKGEMERAKSN